MQHDFIKTGDADSFPQIQDRNGEVALSYCRRCKRAEGELTPTCVDETDAELRARIADAYGTWGAFLSLVIESSGAALDDCAKHVKLERKKIS